ncbi:MAG: NAD(FAD)-utilizing dehydrogenase [Clostridiales Family XIII bacterium]|jgi:uncharacterized FAD-dependent dehydrogenase|nr:NAD(FAD)-utilizing dehydrogenase [Clostridiales Family XIII bacterium]
MIRVCEIRRRVGEPEAVIKEKAARKCGLKSLGFEISEWKISRESIDARNKRDINFVYNVDFTVAMLNGGEKGKISERQETELVKRINMRSKNVRLSVVSGAEAEATRGLETSEAEAGASERQATIAAGLEPMNVRRAAPRPVIAGFGPCGMFAALILAEHGLKPLVLERGKPVEERIVDVERFWKNGVLDPESNVQFGEGGAGTFSDGKLTTGISNHRVGKVLKEFALAGGGEDLLYKAKPHIGTDVLRIVVKNIREKIISLGGGVSFQHRMTGVGTEGGVLRHVMASSPEGSIIIPAEQLILALGHSARDSFKILFDAGLSMSRKPFSIGLRIEHPQDLIDAAQYGEGFTEFYGMTPRAAGLPAAEYKLSHRCKDGRGVYTFCMCPGGRVIAASSSEGLIVSNGMSDRKRDSGFANSAVLVDVRVDDFPTEDPLAGVEFQEKFEKLAFAAGGGDYSLPYESVGALMEGSGSLLAACLPDFAVRNIREGLPVFGKKLKGFDGQDVRLYGVETRSSSPVRIVRSEELEANIKGIYPGGEGAGYAGGIVSAAVDGIRIAEEIIQLY